MTYKERIAITVPNPDANEKTIFNDAADGLLKTKDSSGVVETLATTEGIADTEPKVYVALLTQTGTDAPVATVLKNTLGGVPVWTRDTPGVYNITLSDAFNLNKTVVFVAEVFDNENGVPAPVVARVNNGDESYFPIIVIGDGVGGDGVLNTTSIKIEVYP